MNNKNDIFIMINLDEITHKSNGDNVPIQLLPSLGEKTR